METERREGGCLCGKVRFSVAWPPLMVATCQCRNCQKQAGSALSVIAMVAGDTLEVTGTLSTYEDQGESGNPLFRRFCGHCGSPVVSDFSPELAGGMRIIKAAALDDPSGITPTLHYWTSSAQDWVVLPETGQRLERQ
jgi:hypothetical protein